MHLVCHLHRIPRFFTFIFVIKRGCLLPGGVQIDVHGQYLLWIQNRLVLAVNLCRLLHGHPFD